MRNMKNNKCWFRPLKKRPLWLISRSHQVGFLRELRKVENLLFLKFPYILIKPSCHVTLTFKWPCYTRSGCHHYGGNHQALNFINGTLLRFIWSWEQHQPFVPPVDGSHWGDSFLRDAPQDVFDCVSESGEAYDDEQISERSTQESMVTVDLLEVGRVGRTRGQVPVQGQVPVLCVVGFAIRHHVGKGQRLRARPELFLHTLLLLDFLFDGGRTD